MKSLFVFIILAILFVTPRANAIDVPVLGLLVTQNPPDVQFQITESEHFKVYHPEDLNSEAKRVIIRLEEYYYKVSASLGALPEKLPLILQNQSVDANGFVTFAPRRSEWFTRPWFGPELSCTEWLNTLATHEFRHVAQFHKTMQGFAKFLYVIFGEMGLALAQGWSMPMWFFEGDAVGIETALTNCGRGRVAQFDRDLRAILFSDLDLSYEQSYLGSYKYYRPNHYVYGYLLTTYLRRHYGQDVLQKVQTYALEHGYNPLSFLNGIEEITKKSFYQVFKEALVEYKKLYAEKLGSRKIHEGSNLFKTSNDWINYLYPIPYKDGVIVFKKSYDNIPQLVLKTKDTEKVIYTPTELEQELPLKIVAGKMIIPEVRYDSRFIVKSFTHLTVFDFEKKEVVREFPKTRLFMPELDPEAKKIAAIYWAKDGHLELQILDVETKKVLSKMLAPKGEYLQHIAWINSQELFAITKNIDGLKSMFKIQLETGAFSNLLGPLLENFSYPQVDKNWVYYQSDINGIDEIFRLNLDTKEIQQITTSRFGSYYPRIYNDELWFNSYTVKGHEAHKLGLASISSMPKENVGINYFEPLVEQEKNLMTLKPNYTVRESKKISTSQNLYNPHSWILLAPPLGADAILQTISQDVLSMSQITAGADYNFNEKALTGFANFQFSKYYPIMNVGASYGSRSRVREFNNKNVEDHWEEGGANTSVILPYNQVYRSFLINSSLSQSLKLTHVQGLSYPNNGEVSTMNLFASESIFKISMLERKAKRDIISPLGFDLSLSYENGTDFNNGANIASMKSAQLKYYLPGFFKHHHLFGEYSAESQPENAYYLKSKIFFARGFESRYLQSYQKQSINYLLPIAYPDWNLKRYLYFNRIMLNGFYDHLFTDKLDKEHYESAGAELLFETHFVSNFFPLTWGIRRAEKLGEKSEGEWSVFLSTFNNLF